MEIRIEIKYPGAGLGTLKPLGPLHSIEAAIDWLKRADERVIKPAYENAPHPRVSIRETKKRTVK